MVVPAAAPTVELATATMIDDLITDVLKAEGWDKYTNHPADRGGPTKWGITLKAWQDYNRNPALSESSVQGITEQEARIFYHQQYIIEPGFTNIHSDFLMACVVDAAVNHGPKRAAKWLQRAVGVQQDGDVGPKTIEAVNSAPFQPTTLKFLAYRVRFYGYLVTRNPSQAVFAHGWNNRAAKWLERLADL